MGELIIMKVLNRKIITEAQKKYADANDQLGAWYKEAELAEWKSFADIKRKYFSASQIKNENRFIIIFNIKGNEYRLGVYISYKLQTIKILKFGTHAEYDRWSFGEVNDV